MESDLHQVIKENDDLTPEHYQFFCTKLLRAPKFIYTVNVFHRDLKPKNILANADCKLKIYDFKLARVSFKDAPSAIFWTVYIYIFITSLRIMSQPDDIVHLNFMALSSLKTKEFAYERVIGNKRFNPSIFRNSTKQPMHVNTSSYKQYQPPIITDSTLESNKEAEAGLYGSFKDIIKDWVTDPALYSAMQLEESATQHKLGNDDCDLCPEEPSKKKCSPYMVVCGRKPQLGI
ncbi:hypothetical protein GIB67_043279 [Kingdonia uniflora]|uniref:Protein kinase domain-containing protein n=1 Tax=Kingdonia uniflora TaxID=39325 RepID=A0A7J7L0M1_9MAGN|nr:hypothetical protein GIB67_043279 [Kingdonia uniflora]